MYKRVKLKKSTPDERGFLGWHNRGYLPHHDIPDTTQFITFRLAGSLPESRRDEWEMLLRIENGRQRRAELEAYLDQGHGECWLKRPGIAQLMVDTLKFFAGERYALKSWVVMPNHVHVLVHITKTPLDQVLQNWKVHSALEANRILKRRGVFWEREYWDTRIRDSGHHERALNYIEENPVRAGLVARSWDWKWGSAHERAEAAKASLRCEAGR